MEQRGLRVFCECEWRLINERVYVRFGVERVYSY
jgi:hypothetical protein